jgi:hypothetical protein
LLAHVTSVGVDNLGQVPELLRTGANGGVSPGPIGGADGAIPMMGFGAGAYINALSDRALDLDTSPGEGEGSVGEGEGAVGEGEGAVGEGEGEGEDGAEGATPPRAAPAAPASCACASSSSSAALAGAGALVLLSRMLRSRRRRGAARSARSG